MMNLSERGIGLFTREAHVTGERMTVTLSHSGDSEGVTATGVVRWSNQPASRGRWFPMGLEWLTLEEGTHNRLRSLLGSQVQLSRAPRAFRPARERVLRALLVTTVSLLSIVIGGFVAWYVWLLAQENRQLHGAVQQRNVLIRQLAEHDEELRRELGTAKAQLATTMSEVIRLDQQSQRLGGDVQRLTQHVEQVQQSYVAVNEEREALMRRVLDLEQERLLLVRRWSSVPDLRLAIRDAIKVRQEAQRAQWQSRLQAKRDAERQQEALGNRGYLVWEGRPTIRGPGMLIRVHDPAIDADPGVTPTTSASSQGPFQTPQ